MAEKKLLQAQFGIFHETIKLHNTDDNAILREKRDMLVKEIRDYLNNKFQDSEDATPTFKEFNQGSYSMNTGTKPTEGNDYDIDVGLDFNFDNEEYTPIEVKTWIFEALDKKPNRTVIWKKPCIRVQYFKKGEEAYHVDFACYTGKDYNTDEKMYLGWGTPNSTLKEFKTLQNKLFKID